MSKKPVKTNEDIEINHLVMGLRSRAEEFVNDELLSFKSEDMSLKLWGLADYEEAEWTTPFELLAQNGVVCPGLKSLMTCNSRLSSGK